MSSLLKETLKDKMPPTSRPPALRSSLGSKAGAKKRGGLERGRKRDYTPVPWQTYFDSYKDVETSPGNKFRVYLKGSKGPAILLLHGGGYCGLTWSLLTQKLSHRIECRIIAIDLRGHGGSHTTNDEDLSAETLSSDVGNVIAALFADEEMPGIILVGHSMGGAIGVHTVFGNKIPTAIAIVVIDVVEGTALSALQSMQNVLRSRPKTFASLPIAIEWCVRSGQVRNVDSAKVSMPGQLKNIKTNICAAHELPLNTEDKPSVSAPRFAAPADTIPEEFENPSAQSGASSTSINLSLIKPPTERVSIIVPKYAWRIDLSKSEKFWNGWFQGLSSMFLSSSIPKLLLLAGVDRLDRDLTIAQMQGKFQMQVLPQCGHAVHEDDPDNVCEAIASFLIRHKFVTSLTPDKPILVASC